MRTPDLFADPRHRIESPAERHSRLALSAARRLKRAQQRERAERLVCHHLRCMLEQEQPKGAGAMRSASIA